MQVKREGVHAGAEEKEKTAKTSKGDEKGGECTGETDRGRGHD